MEKTDTCLPKTVWVTYPELRHKSVVNLRHMVLNTEPNKCGNCSSHDSEMKTSHKWGFYTSKIRTDDYERLLDLGFSRSGTFIDKSDAASSCCPLYTSRLDCTEFKLSKQQKKHMKRFNQYINGEREFKKSIDPIILRHPKDIMKDNRRKIYAKFLENIKKEQDELKKLIIEAICNNDDFNVQGQDIVVKDYKRKISDSRFAYYSCNVANVILEQTKCKKQGKSRQPLIKALKDLLLKTPGFQESFDIYNNPNAMVFGSKKWLNPRSARANIFSSNKTNEYNEQSYVETGEERKIALGAADSRPYTDFFEEFVPNPAQESGRAHNYTVSLHRAICYRENLELYRKFVLCRFDQERLKQDFETFLANSCLYDPKDPEFETAMTFKEEDTLDANRVFKDEGVYPQYFGTYHLHHRIDGRLVAINVWDITEHTLSSVHTFYDPEYSFLSLGHVTAVREIEYMQKVRKEFNPNMKYYYMGEYDSSK